MHEVDLTWMQWLSREEFALCAALWFSRFIRDEMGNVNVHDGMLAAAAELRRRHDYQFEGLEIDEGDNPHKVSTLPVEARNRLWLDNLLVTGRSFDWAWMFKTGIQHAEASGLNDLVPVLKDSQKRVDDMRRRAIEERTPEEEEAMREAMEHARQQATKQEVN